MKRVVLYGIIGFLLLDFMGIAVVKAQEVKSRVISGIVRNRDNRKELENVNVSVVGSNVGTVTNKDGVFSLKVSEEEKYPGRKDRFPICSPPGAKRRAFRQVRPV